MNCMLKLSSNQLISIEVGLTIYKRVTNDFKYLLNMHILVKGVKTPIINNNAIIIQIKNTR